MLELKEEIVQVKFRNKIYDVRVPSVEEMRDYEAKLVKEDTDKVELMYELLNKVGLPLEELKLMTFNHLRAIQESFVPKK